MKKTVTIFLLVVFLILGICFYLYMYAPTSQSVPETEPEITNTTDQSGTTTTSQSPGDQGTVPEPEAIVVPPEAISDGQQQVLETFGVDTENIVITPAMITCAKREVGAERLQEIQAGAAPTFLEGIALLGCYE